MTNPQMTARELLGNAITAFEKSHADKDGMIDLSGDADDREIYLGMVALLFGNKEVKHG